MQEEKTLLEVIKNFLKELVESGKEVLLHNLTVFLKQTLVDFNDRLTEAVKKQAILQHNATP